MAYQPIKRSDLLALPEYERQRAERLKRVMALRNLRRIEVGPWVSLAFENRETVIHQIHEMLRVERITQPAAIDHEIETFEELLPREGELSATLFIEIPDAHLRSAALSKLGGIEGALHLKLGGRNLPAYDKRPIPAEFARPGQASAVYYLGLKILEPLRTALSASEAWLEFTHPEYRHAAALSAELRRELARDLVG